MDLPYKSFVKYGANVGEDLTFTVFVRNVLSDHKNPKSWSSATTTISLAAKADSSFEIVLISPTFGTVTDNKDGQYFVKSNEMNELRVRLKNYRLTDPNMQYIWKITPKEKILNPDLVKHAADNSAVLLYANSLAPD